MTEPTEFSWAVRVVATDRDAAGVFVRTHRFEAGVPLSFDSEEKRITALEYVLGAIGADIVVGFQRIARKRRLAVDAIEATVRSALNNPLTYLGVVGEHGDPGIRAVHVRVYIATIEPKAAVDAAWHEALALSPLVSTFRRALELELSYKVTP